MYKIGLFKLKLLDAPATITMWENFVRRKLAAPKTWKTFASKTTHSTLSRTRASMTNSFANVYAKRDSLVTDARIGNQ